MFDTRHTLIVGLGITGMSCLRFLYTEDRITVLDTRSAPAMLEEARNRFPEVEFVCGRVPKHIFADVDRVVVSPGVALNSPFLEEVFRRKLPVISDIDLFLNMAKAPVIGITGTNGKSTVTELCGQLLSSVGLKVEVGGNLGKAALDLLNEDADVYVLELSSFQLERLALQADVKSPLEVGCLLNISDDHLDRHDSMENYIAAKKRIQSLSNYCVFNRDDALTAPGRTFTGQLASFGLGCPVEGQWGIVEQENAGETSRYLSVSGVQFFDVTKLRIFGVHNQMNALAALALASTQHDKVDAFKPALAAFQGLQHRCQFVETLTGITFINDSKATNAGACIAALDGLGDPDSRNIVLIAGGDSKQADLSAMTKVVQRYVKFMVVIGTDAKLLAALLPDSKAVYFASDMSDAVNRAFEVAARSELVLLSPACASFDMYANYEARGAAFIESVKQLSQGQASAAVNEQVAGS